MKRTKVAIPARHPALTCCLGASIGLGLMHMESEILVAVLMEMMAREIIGLGIHDGLLAPVSKADEVRLIMEDMAVEKTGTTIPVTVEALS